MKKRNDDGSSEKKKRRVNFSTIDVGVDANDCIKVFLVSSHEEIDRSEGSSIQVNMNQFFGEDGKIYGYNGLKIDIWLSIISYHAYPVISFERKFDGSKGITDIDQILQNIFGASLILGRDDFTQTFSSASHYVRDIITNGKVVKSYSPEVRSINNGHPDAVASAEDQIVSLQLSNPVVGQLYNRLVPLLLLLVEGSSPVEITDLRWEIYLAARKKIDQSGDVHCMLYGFALVYHFYHYPDSSRLRIGQILVLPPYQGKGHGRLLLETVNSIAISSQDIYDVTIEEPSEYLQNLRDCIDTVRLLSLERIKPAITFVSSKLKHGSLAKKAQNVNLCPPKSTIEEVRKELKINKKQFCRCWDILIYLALNHDHSCSMENFRTCLTDRLSSEVFGKDSDTEGKRLIDIPNKYGDEKTFVMFRGKGTSIVSTLNIDAAIKEGQEEQLKQLVDERMKEIFKVADKVSAHCRTLGIQPFQ